jgi:tRNA(Ile)-lysidine synthase
MAAHAIESELAAAWPPHSWGDVTVLLAVSGGPDSVALLRAMAALKSGGRGRLLVAHVNHQLRGEESDADEAFVVDLCRRLEVPCEVQRVSPEGRSASCPKGPEAASHKAGRSALPGHDLRDGLEAAARSVRYDLLRQAACRVGARYVATAHTADDQAETILHRVLRGTGIAGLSGMARVRPLGPATLIRPFLGLRRAELLGYLQDLGQPYRVDASNADTRFTRNRIRHDLLPELAARFNPGVVDALLRLGSLAGEVQTVVDGIVEGLSHACLSEQGPDAVRIRVQPVADQPRYVVRELLMAVWRRRGWPLQAMGLHEWEVLAEMLLACQQHRPPRERTASTPRKRTFPGAILAEAEPGQLCVWRPAGANSGHATE